MHAVGTCLQPCEPAAQAEELTVAVDDHGLLGIGEAGEGNVRGDALVGAESKHDAPLMARCLGAPWLDRPFGKALAAVWDDQVEIDIDGTPESLAGLASSQWAVERKQVGHRVAVGQVAGRAMQVLAETQWLALG